jgi:hypothetical protein
MRIEIKSMQVAEKRGNAARTGKPYVIREQKGWMETGKDYPSEVTISLQDDQVAFAPGFYQLTPACFWVGRFGVVNVDLSKIVPVKPAVTQPTVADSFGKGARVAG